MMEVMDLSLGGGLYTGGVGVGPLVQISLSLPSSLRVYVYARVSGGGGGATAAGVFIAKPELSASVLSACFWTGDLGVGREIHALLVINGWMEELVFLSTTLVDLYLGCHESLMAFWVFERMEVEGINPNRVTLVAILPLCIEGVQPNHVTLLAVISACTALRSICHGRGVHGFVLKSGLFSDLFIGNSLLDMYSKYGCLVDLYKIFKEMSMRDNFSWSTLIGAYGLHGRGKESLQLFLEMLERVVEPDAVAFLSVLSACNHAGHVEEGKHLFSKALKDDKIPLSMEHYACHDDLLGRAGDVKEAGEVVSRMPMKPSIRIWSSLISACTAHGRLEV
ncbi:PPR superfamily protein [Actinidia rufa]|uniref:PPR superfamily protein n=1 Tax=Actinidia rufa TaxID=165716 RepID=A0A7J0HEZ5_9ERIC|nr:PPR superfamily protein [Actinidia rufa]